jgi:hypothetical protein
MSDARVDTDGEMDRPDQKSGYHADRAAPRAILERLPEGDEDEHDIFLRSAEQADIDEWTDDGADGE